MDEQLATDCNRDRDHTSIGYVRWPIVLGVMLFCIAVRTIVIGYFFDDLSSDPDSYRALAIGWHETGVFGRLQNRDTSNETVTSPVATTFATPTAYRPPLYPWLLSWFASERSLGNTPVAILHIILGAATCYLAGSIAAHVAARTITSTGKGNISISNSAITSSLTKSRQQGDRSIDRKETKDSTRSNWAFMITAILVAMDPLLMRQSCLVMTETIATMLCMLTVYVWVRNPFWDINGIEIGAPLSVTRRCVAGAMLGVILGISILCRPAGLVWYGLIVTGMIAFSFRRKRIDGALRVDGASNGESETQTITNTTTRPVLQQLFVAGAVALAGLLALAPWIIRNQNAFHRPIATTTHGGYTLLLANNDILYDHFETSSSRDWAEDEFHQYWRNEKAQHSDATEVEMDRIANSLAIATIEARPAVFARACFIRLGWFWALWPADRQAGPTQQLLIGLWNGCIYAMAIAGCGLMILGPKRRLESIYLLMPCFALIVSLCGIHAVYWSNMRMRAPCVPILALFAGVFGAWCITAIQSRRRPS